MTVRPAATPEQRRRSLHEWETLARRYPLTSLWQLAWPAATALGGNLVVAWLVATGRMSPLELVLLVAVEAVLLVGIAMLQARFVPAEAIQKSPLPLRDRLVTFLFGLTWLALVYGLVMGAFVPQGEELARLRADPAAFLLSSNLKWPLLITLAGAGVDALQDHAHFARHAGIFYSTPGLQGAARWMTLFLGGIPFFMPLVVIVGALVVVGKKLGELFRLRGQPDREALAMTAAVPVLGLVFFATFGWLVQSDLDGWAIGYATAKFAAELFIVCIPLIARQAHAEEKAALEAPVAPASPAAQSRRKSRLP